jgi:hypothetical protein
LCRKTSKKCPNIFLITAASQILTLPILFKLLDIATAPPRIRRKYRSLRRNSGK